jgi:hypothetical protein
VTAPNRQGDLYVASHRDHKPDALALAEERGRLVFDVVSIDWLQACETARQLLPIK